MPLADSDSQRTHERIGAMFFLAAVPLSLPGLLEDGQRAVVLTYLVVATAAVVGLGLLRGGRPAALLRDRVPEIGTVLLTVGITAGGTISQYYAILYVWIALDAGLFQPPPRMIRALGLVAVGSAVALTVSMESNGFAIVRWALVVATCVGTSLASAWLVARYEGAQRAAVAARAEAESASLTDVLTGVANRRSGEHALERALASAQRAHRPIATLMVDIDEFKRINDERGHAAGDAALVEIAARLVRATRSADAVARWGGDEFLVVLDGPTDVESVSTAAERIRYEVAAAPLASGTSATVSIGGAITTAPDPRLSEELTNAADRALYDAKREGRNRIAITTTAARLRAAG